MEYRKNFVLTLIRHAESCGNVGIYYEDNFHKDDPPLSPEGLKQAEKLSESSLLDNADMIFSSSLIRAVQTVYPAAERLRKKIVLLTDLMEIHTEIPGTDESRLVKDYPLALPYSSSPNPTGGTLFLSDKNSEEIKLRAERCIDYFYKQASDNCHIVAVTHGSYFGYLVRAALGLDLPETFCWQVDNCCATRIIFRKDSIPKLSFANYTGHLNHIPVCSQFIQIPQEVIK